MSDELPNVVSEDDLAAEIQRITDKRIKFAIDPLVARIEALEGRTTVRRHSFAPYLDILRAIRPRLDEGAPSQELGNRYNEVVDQMVKDLGPEWAEFKLPQSAFYEEPGRRVHDGRTVTHVSVSKPIFILQIDSLLNRIRGLMPPDDARRAGFPTN